jgi:type I restriction enzyme S subunit
MEKKVGKQFPSGWKWIKLEDVISEAQPGFACGERDPNGIIQVRMNNLDTRGNLVWNDFIRVPATSDQINKYQLQDKDVIFNNTNSSELVGKSALFVRLQEPVVYSNHFTRLRTIGGALEPSYLAAWLVFQWQYRTFEHLCNRWIGQSAVKNDKLLSLKIPLPPLNEQKRITAILNEYMEAVEKARKATEEQLEAAKELTSAYLRAVFNSPEAQKWNRKKLGEICNKLTDGTHQPPIFTSEGVPFLFVKNIVSGQLDFNVTQYVSESTYQELTKRCRPEKGDILYSAVGSFGVAVVVDTDKSFIFQRHIAHLKPIKEKIDSFYLTNYINSPEGRKQSDKAALGVAQRTVTLTSLSNFEIPIPSLQKQNQIVSELNQKITQINRINKSLKSQLEAINQLPSIILRKAFNGEL